MKMRIGEISVERMEENIWNLEYHTSLSLKI